MEYELEALQGHRDPRVLLLSFAPVRRSRVRGSRATFAYRLPLATSASLLRLLESRNERLGCGEPLLLVDRREVPEKGEDGAARRD